MGNQVSSQSENKKIEPIKEKEDESVNIVKDTYSSYKGLKTELSDQPNKETKDTNTSDSMTTLKRDNTVKPEDIKAPTHFEWREGGEVVYVTGSFSNWTQWFVMNRVTSTKFFELTLVLIPLI
jgi:hypothetical protein